MSTLAPGVQDRARVRAPAVTAVFLLLAGTLALVACSVPQVGNEDMEAPAEVADAPAPGDPVAGDTSVQIDCGGAEQPVTVSAELPKSPTFPPEQQDFGLDALQCDFDVFSWNSFLALAHDADGGFGGGDDVPLWQTWPDEGDIFLPGGAEPPAWPAGQPPPAEPVPPVCEGVAEGGEAVLSMIGKQPLLTASLEPFNSGPLIDVHGRYARFGITVNQPMYAYIRDHGLYSQAGQKRFSEAGHAVEFPCGCKGESQGKTCPEAGQQGAVMVKAAWKVLDTGAGDDPSRFHTARALVHTPAIGDQPETCERQLVGLVGLHIATKTQADPQWLWSTFEQVDNVPTEGETPPAGKSYNFFQADCDDCNAVNTTPPEPWNPHDQPVGDNSRKSQVVRQIAITEATDELNAKVHTLLGGTVWRHYELISTQWPTDANGSAKTDPSAANNWCTPLNPIDETGAPAPAFLANTTLETYIQGTVPQASSSCIHCHQNATMAAGQNNFSDFTYLLERAN